MNANVRCASCNWQGERYGPWGTIDDVRPCPDCGRRVTLIPEPALALTPDQAVTLLAVHRATTRQQLIDDLPPDSRPGPILIVRAAP